MPRLKFILLFCLLLLLPRFVWAQDRAQELYDQALVAFEAGDYETAVEKFEAAYEIAPRPVLVYNIAVAHGRNADYRSALKYAELAALQGLESPEAEKNAARIVAWSVALHAQQFEPPVAEIAAPVEPLGSTRSKTGWKIAGIGLLAAGAGAGVLAGVMELQLASHVNDFERATDPDRANAILEDEIRPRQTTARIASGVAVGAGMLGIAVLVYALIPSRERQGTVVLEPSGVSVRF